MKKDFKQELIELINKHSLEKEMRDTPDYILAQVCVDAMAVFSEAIARRDEWHGFRKADEKSSQDAKHNYPDDCNICKDRFKCADFMRTQPIANLIQRFKTTTDKEGKTAIAGLQKQINADASGKPQNDIPEEVKEEILTWCRKQKYSKEEILEYANKLRAVKNIEEEYQK